MEFQPDKCTVLTVANYLNWGSHITNICNKVNRTLGLLRRNLHISSKEIKERACKSIVRPQLQYASTVWDPYQQGHIDQIEPVQRRSARCVTEQEDIEIYQV